MVSTSAGYCAYLALKIHDGYPMARLAYRSTHIDKVLKVSYNPEPANNRQRT
jgi:hypothetical protein